MKKTTFLLGFVKFILFTAGFLAVWIGCDYLFTTCIAQGTFQFSAATDVIMPLIPAIPTAILALSVSLRKKAS